MTDVTEAATQTPGLPYRPRAREHLAKARDRLADGDLHSTMAACLFLRMAIEALAYNLLEAYRSEVDFTAMRKWQPSKVIDELREIDAGADRGASITITSEQDGKTILVGEEKRLTAEWISKAHRALGSFLHEPTIRQVEEGKPRDEAAIRAKAESIAAEIDAVLASPVYNINIGQFVEFQCVCGFGLRRKLGALKDSGVFRCAECGRYWSYLRDDAQGRFGFTETQGQFACERCGTPNAVTRRDLEAGARLRCDCGAQYEFVQAFQARLVEKPPIGPPGGSAPASEASS
jgi:ribosomal protein S14